MAKSDLIDDDDEIGIEKGNVALISAKWLRQMIDSVFHSVTSFGYRPLTVNGEFNFRTRLHLEADIHPISMRA